MGQELLAPAVRKALGRPSVASPSVASSSVASPAARSSSWSSTASTVLARDRLLPLLAPLDGLFPEGGLRKGITVHVGRGSPGLTSLALTLLSAPCAGGSWCAVVGAPDLGLVAASQLGLDLEHLAIVPSPGPRWAVVTAALLEGFDLVLLRVTGQASYTDARRLEARARERGSVLVVMADDWPGTADMHVSIVAGRWLGLEEGHGHLWGCEVEVIAGGKGAASRQRRAKLWFGQPPLEHVARQLEPVSGEPSGVPGGEVVSMDIAG
jgi:hypothetical protein